MKNFAITLITCGLFYCNLSAQETKVGFKAGLNIANLKEKGVNSTNKIGFHGGFILESFVSEKFSIQPELLYSTQGSKEKGNLEMPFPYQNIRGEAILKLSYINIPVMFKYYPIKNLSFEAGPQIGFLINSKLDFESTYSPTITLKHSDLEPLLKKFDYGLNFGLEYNNSGVIFSARYNLGLANINNNTSEKVHNRVFQISTGYKF